MMAPQIVCEYVSVGNAPLSDIPKVITAYQGGCSSPLITPKFDFRHGLHARNCALLSCFCVSTPVFGKPLTVAENGACVHAVSTLDI